MKKKEVKELVSSPAHIELSSDGDDTTISLEGNHASLSRLLIIMFLTDKNSKEIYKLVKGFMDEHEGVETLQ